MEETVLVLVSAHFAADFLFQPDWLQQRKERLWGVLLHAFISAGAAYLFLQQWTAWPLPVLVLVLHALTDFIKRRCTDTWRAFCVDQLVHLLCTAAIVQLCLATGWVQAFSGTGLKAMVLLAGFAVAVPGSGFLVGRAALQLQQENGLAGALTGLANGGKLIGQLERALIFILILTGQPGGIGFLIAAKSILRFSEARESQKLAEYVLIGTLLSFGLAIAVSSLTLRLIGGLQP